MKKYIVTLSDGNMWIVEANSRIVAIKNARLKKGKLGGWFRNNNRRVKCRLALTDEQIKKAMFKFNAAMGEP